MHAEKILGPAGLLRRLAAAVYDGLLVIGILMLMTLLLVIAGGGEAVPAGKPAYQASVLLVMFLFFAGFWTRGGQTLGMRAWRLRLESRDGEPVSWMQAAKRFAAAFLAWLPLGLGMLWILVDRQGLSWQDRLSDTRVVLLAK